MFRKWLSIPVLLLSFSLAAQESKSNDTLPAPAADTSFLAGMDSFDYDSFFDEMEGFLDSLLRPSSYLRIGLRGSTGYYNYKIPNRALANSRNRLVFSPSVSYYNRSGFGLAIDADIIPESGSGLYQGIITPSYDYLRNTAFSTGISYSRYIHKDNIPFYLSPLKNEVAAYFVYREKWLWPSVSASFAWGNRSDYQERIDYIRLLRLRRRLSNAIAGQPHISDLSVTAALSHNFYHFDVFSKKDFFRFSPQVFFNAGTQQFGFNSATAGSMLNQFRRSGSVNSSRSLDLDATKSFEALSAGVLLKASYTTGKFFIQPQLRVEYYFPANDDQLSLLGALAIGMDF